MRSNKIWLGGISVVLLINIFISGCREKEVYLGKFNPKIWKRDYNGCDGNREREIENLYKIRQEFYGVGEQRVLEILGKPNKQELSERGKKAYLYYYKGGKSCFLGVGVARLLIIDFNALDKVSLITVRME